MTFHTVDVGLPWLTEQHEAHIVLIQVKPPPPETMMADASRPWVIRTVEKLLGPDAALAQIVTGQKPTLLVLPELALGFEDWEKIDSLVREWGRPLVLITGFGFTKGERLTAWLTQNTSTIKAAAWSS